MDWQLFVFNPENDWLSVFDKMAQQRFNNQGQADAAVNEIIKSLSENNWQALGNIKEMKSPGAYLTTVFRRKLEDKARQIFGRPRAPKWLKQLGGIWMTLFRWLCLERKSKMEIMQGWPDNESHQQEVDTMISTIRSKYPQCGSADCQEVSLEQHQQMDPSFEPQTEDNEDIPEDLLLALAHHCGIADIPSSVVSDLHSGLQQLQLTAQQQLLLKLIYQQGKKISEVARLLHTADHQIRTLHKNTLNLLKNCITVRQ